MDSDCVCLSSDRMGAYIHGLAVVLPSRDSVSSPLLLPVTVSAGLPHVLVTWVPGDLSDIVSIHLVDVRPGSVSYVSHRAETYDR